MHRAQILARGQNVGNLLDAVLAGVQQHHLDVTPIAGLLEDIVDELLIVGRVGFHQHQFMAASLGFLGGGWQTPRRESTVRCSASGTSVVSGTSPGAKSAEYRMRGSISSSSGRRRGCLFFTFLLITTLYSVCSPFISFTKLLTESVSRWTETSVDTVLQLTFAAHRAPGIRSLAARSLHLSTGAAPMSAGTARRCTGAKTLPVTYRLRAGAAAKTREAHRGGGHGIADGSRWGERSGRRRDCMARRGAGDRVKPAARLWPCGHPRTHRRWPARWHRRRDPRGRTTSSLRPHRAPPPAADRCGATPGPRPAGCPATR